MVQSDQADAVLILLDAKMDWKALKRRAGTVKVVIAANSSSLLEGAAEVGFPVVNLNMAEQPISEKLTQAVLESVADDILAQGAAVAALYSFFTEGEIDTISLIRLDERLGKLTVRDLRQLETTVPLDILKYVVDLAVDIGREGREGKTVGTMFVVGEHRKVLKHCHTLGFDPFKGYSKKERNLEDAIVREGVKETAMMDGAYIISADGTVEAGVQYISAPSADITLSKGLGARHWAAAAISRATKSVAVTVSESNGTVRIFQNGEVMLRIEPLRRALKWKGPLNAEGSDSVTKPSQS